MARWFLGGLGMNSDQNQARKLNSTSLVCELGAFEQPQGGCGTQIIARCRKCVRSSCGICYTKNQANGGKCPGPCFGKFVLDE